MFTNPSRRQFLQSVAAAIASLILPKSLFASEPAKFWFLHSDTGNSWPVADPVLWSLENAHEPILERARERLITLDATDPQRIIRLVTRRCKLNLIEVQPKRVVVHHWGEQGQADLRPFFKQHGLSCKSVKVTLIDRKREVSTVNRGDHFLYGELLIPLFPFHLIWINLFQKKWERRHIEETGDWKPAPDSWSGYAWEGVEDNFIPWAALKSAWRRTSPFVCLNCDQPTVMTNFGYPQCSMFNRCPRFIHLCGGCRRLFEDHSIRDVPGWMMANLDADVLPDFDIFWGKRRKWEGATNVQ